MKVKEANTSIIFEADELKQELVIESLDFFIGKFKKLNLNLSAIYPADAVALPFSMYVSDKLSVPVKTEKFLKPSDSILMVFSYLPFNCITKNYIYDKIKLFRNNFPNSPSILIASTDKSESVDFQLLEVKKLSKVNSYRFLSEAMKNFFYPLKGEFTHFSPEFWLLSKHELKSFEKAKRIRDSAKRYLREEETSLRLVENYLEIAIWEKFQKNLLVVPEIEEKEGAVPKIKIEKLIQVSDKVLNSAVTSLLEYFSQNLETYFPTHLAYSNLEVFERKGVVIIPKITQVMDGADVKLEVVLRSENVKVNFKRLVIRVKETLKKIFTEIFNKEAFRPSVESVVEKEINKATIYINWFLDSKMVEALYNRTNRKWLLTRLLYRKQFKSRLKAFIKSLNGFSFTPENFEKLFSTLESLWKRNPQSVKLYSKEIKKAFEDKGLLPLIGVYGLKVEFGKAPTLKELLKFLLSLNGYENLHQFFAKENRYFVPVKTKRIYRPNWERLIREKQKVSLKAEPLNPDSPVTYILHSENGKFLGTIPEVVGHYLSAKESSGEKVVCKKLYFDPYIFSNTSYWVEIECL